MKTADLLPGGNIPTERKPSIRRDPISSDKPNQMLNGLSAVTNNKKKNDNKKNKNWLAKREQHAFPFFFSNFDTSSDSNIQTPLQAQVPVRV